MQTNTPFTLRIDTKRLVIRNLESTDHGAYFQIFGNPNIALYDDFAPITAEEAVQNIEEILEKYRLAHHEQELAVALKPENETIGILYMKNESDRTLIGYHFNEAFHGKGYAIEAVKAFIHWITLDPAKSIEALVDKKNQPSIQLLKNLGFVQKKFDSDELVFMLPHAQTTHNQSPENLRQAY